MKKNYILILLLAIGIGIAGFFLYKWWESSRTTNIWSVVPTGTALALETTDFVKTWNDLQLKSVWKSFSTIPEFLEVKQKIDFVDSLTGKNGSLADFLKGKQVVFSVHPVSNTNFDFAFYLPVKSSGDREFLKKMESTFENNKEYRKGQRNFQGININVIKSRKQEKSLSFIIHNNLFIGSYNPLLIEDVIRTIDSEKNFLAANKEVFDLSKAGVESAKVYVDYSYFHKFLSLFVKEEADELLTTIKNFGKCSSLDVNLSHQDILLNGFTIASNPKDFLNCFKDQKSQPFNVKRFVSNRTSVFYHYGFDDAVKLKESFKSFWNNNDLEIAKQWQEINSKYKVDLNTFFPWINNEIGLSILESMNAEDPDKLVYVSVKTKEEASASLDALVSQISSLTRDTIYSETFADTEIKQINIKQFPSILFGRMFSGFDQCYYVFINNYLVFSNSIQSLKGVILDIEREDTWGKSIKQNLFLEQCLGESNISIFANGPRFWSIFESSTSGKWQSFFKKYSSQIKRFENMALQFSYVDNKFYTSVILKHINLDKEELRKERFELVKRSELESPVITRPFVVKNHYNKSNEIFLQDSLNQIYLISREGQILWKKPIESEIVGEVVQVDYFKNGKLQLCFATESKLHIVDRNGVEVGKFPVDFPENIKAHNLSVIDYDNSKDYRFLMSDKEGSIFMYDKKGKNLEGWTPRTTTRRLAAPVRHVRVKNRDYLIAVQQDGIVRLFTRRGENYKGFPLDLKGPLAEPLFMEQGPTAALTKFSTITESGMYIQFNLLGEILKQEQWVKPGKDSKFSLISDVFQRNWVIVRQDLDKIAILSSDGNNVFQQEIPTNTSLSIQFYNFGGGNEIYAVTDHEQEFTFLYNKDGRLVNSTPVESSFQIGLTYSESTEKYRVYKAFAKEASVVTFK
ncbi:MAG TPA: hypothetical protein VD908_13250 [Cytophagales bacterium]|nr:hypothetical protein [Cytophagales bacterium]